MIKLKPMIKEVYDINLLENSGKYKIFCDLDGVLVDFNKAIRLITGGLSFEEYIRNHSRDELWALVNTYGSDWWSSLSWTSDGHKLWDFIKGMDVTILTSCSRRNTKDIAITGKKAWCSKNLGADVAVIVTDSSSNKQKYSTPSNILIDDLPENIFDWKTKGGIGILHTNSDQSIKELQ
jgi:hypothetical protein